MMIPDNITEIDQAECRFLVSSDVSGEPLAGERDYIMHIPGNMPACSYWSVIVYDTKTKLIVKNNQLWPSVHSNCKKLVVNEDHSFDVWFGTEPVQGKEYNWIQTVSRRGWYMILRLYDLKDINSVKNWSPGKIIPVNNETGK